MIVNLHIGRLVIEGLPVGGHETSLVRLALSAELTRLVSEKGLAKDLGHRRFDPLVRAPPITSPARDAGSLADEIASRIYVGILG